MGKHETSKHLVVVGGGLAGLTAAAYAARAGHRVTLLERAAELGGRAGSTRRDDFVFNQGPHALYRTTPGMGVLRELGIKPKGKCPDASGGFAVRGGSKHTLPGGLVSLLSTGLLGVRGKIEIAGVLASLTKIDPAPLQGVTVRDWVAGKFRDPVARQLIEALVRLTSYVADPGRHSAGAAIEQLKHAITGNVVYLDGGWQSLVDALVACSARFGAQCSAGTRVRSISVQGGGWSVVCDGPSTDADVVILAVPPSAAAGLLEAGGAKAPATALRRAAEACTPARVACLDLALDGLPKPKSTFALGVDEPLYFSVHSAAARLAPQGKALVHVAKYLGAEAADSERHEAELEALADLVQPGWRTRELGRRFLPNMTAACDIPHASRSGLKGRPGVVVSGARNLFVAGDWVGAQGQLADAALCSAVEAARAAASATEVARAAA